MEATTDHVVTGPDFDLELSSVDQAYCSVYSRRILAFEHVQGGIEHITSILIASLQATVNQIPYLAGSIVGPDVTGRTDFRYKVIPGKAFLKVKDLSADVDFAKIKAKGFPSAEFVHDTYVGVPHIAFPTIPRDVCVIQANFVHGGLFLVFSFHHIIADGTGITSIMRLFAQHCKALQQNKDYDREQVLAKMDPHLSFDRDAIVQLDGAIDHDAILRYYNVYDSVDKRFNYPASVGAVANMDFRLPASAVVELKSAASLDDGHSWITSSDAVNALLWRAIIRARLAAGVLQPSDEVYYFNSVEFRSKLPTPLPSGYIGNAFLLVSTDKLRASELVGENGLKRAAQLIRQSITAVDVRLIKSFIHRTKSVENPLMMETKAIAKLSTTSLFASSQRGFIHSTMEWGPSFGNYEGIFVPSGSPVEGFLLVKPPLPDNAWETSVSLLDRCMELLEKDEEWNKYSEEVKVIQNEH